MSGSVFGNYLKVSTWGESHGRAIGAVVDGCPAGLPLSEADIQPYLDRRKPGSGRFVTQRKEADEVQILSGVFEGKTTGTPISLLVYNTSQRSADYSEIASCYRPGHADYTYDEKYGFRDYRGGGRSSGRETTGRVAAGAVARKLLADLGVDVCAYTKSIGPVRIDPDSFDRSAITETATGMPDRDASARAEAFLADCMEKKDSAGGVVECIITGLPAGIGDPVFDKLDARLAAALMSIGAVKAVEVGDGVAVTSRRGSENNDPFSMEQGHIAKKSNHAGGILGGISDGSPVILRAHIKPTPSIFREQQTVGTNLQDRILAIKGRHDPVIVPRAVVVVESMAALTVADLMLSNLGARMEYLHRIYKSPV
ncbi:MAG: chorismate synthase, partial [Eubacteriales bacterium]|nr:chorismate synthase [Eubacteriales bacterium]